LNIIEEGRHRLVVFMNDASRYTIALKNIKHKDWSKLPQIFIDNLREVMLDEQINPDVIELYINNLGVASYYKNSDKQMTSWLNKACEAACLGYSNYDTNISISRFINRYHVGSKDENDYWQPYERFHQKLNEYGLPLKRCNAYRLSIKLYTLEGWVKREILVPENINFEQLHRVINSAYCWWGYQALFNYTFYKNDKIENDPELILYNEHDPFQFPEYAKPMTEYKLSDYLGNYRTFRYLYDYTAHWHHYIDVIEAIKDCTETLPLLLSGEGDAPPDKVGGVEGYANFLKELKADNYKDRKNAEQWGKQYGYKPFDFISVGEKVKRSLRY